MPKREIKKILIVVDMQNDFVDGALGSKEAVKIIDNAVNKITEFEGNIYVTYDTHSENYLDTYEGKKLPITHCVENTIGWMLNEKIADALHNKQYTEIKKNTFGSLLLPDMVKKYVTENKCEITLIGLCTDICVLANAILLKTHFPEDRIIVDSSCCAGVTPQTHEAALKSMEMCQIDII